MMKNISTQRLQGLSIGMISSAEFQVIIAIDFDDGRLFPLTENLPQCLLPIGNEKILRLQLNSLEKCGATDVLIVSPEDYKVQITSSLADYSSDVMKVELVSVTSDDFQGTADCLRFISKRIRGDFTFLSSDIICQFNIGDLINYHRINAADVTLGMIGCRIDEPEKKGGPKKIQVEEDEQEFSCLSSTGRLLMKVPISETEKALTLHKSLLYKSDGKLKLRTDIIDSGLYVFSRWIIDLLLENTALNSVRSELIPYLLQRQFQSSEYLHGEMPSIKHSKFRSAKGIDKWLSYKQSLPRQQQQLYLQESNDNTQSTEASYMKVSTKDSIKKSFRTKELCDYILEDLSASENSVSQMNSNLNLSESVPVTDHQYLGGMTSGGSPVLSKRKGSNLSTEDSSIIERTRLAATNTASGNTINNKVEEEDDDEDETDFESDFIRCFAYVCEHTQGNTGGILQRVSSANAYLALNRDMPQQQGPYAAKFANYQKKEQLVASDGLEMGDKVTIKQSSIGKKCSVGAKSKVNNCVLMDNVRIGEGCTIQNTILASDVVVEANCNLNDCQVASGTVITAGTKLKGESVSGAM